MYKCFVGLMIVTFAAASGCGSADSTSAPGTSAAVASETPPSDPIAKVVYDFLLAVKEGESELASTKLTPLAQQRMRESKQGFALSPDGTASFRIGAVERMEDAADQAAVDAVWMEPDETGKLAEQRWTVALQRGEAGWGIIGILGEAQPDQPPMILDFENPGQTYATQNGTTSAPLNSVPQQAQRPAAQDPFRQ